MRAGALAANTGFGPRDILGMTISDLHFWNACLNLYYEHTKPKG